MVYNIKLSICLLFECFPLKKAHEHTLYCHDFSKAYTRVAQTSIVHNLLAIELCSFSSSLLFICLMAIKFKLESVHSMLWKNYHIEINKHQEEHAFIIKQYGKEKLWNYFSLPRLLLHSLHSTPRDVPHGINDLLSFAACIRISYAMG